MAARALALCVVAWFGAARNVAMGGRHHSSALAEPGLPGRRGRGRGRGGDSEEEANSKSSCATTDSGYDGMATPQPRRRTANKTFGSDEESCPVVVYVPRSRRRRRRPPTASATRLTSEQSDPWVPYPLLAGLEQCCGGVFVCVRACLRAACVSEEHAGGRGAQCVARCRVPNGEPFFGGEGWTWSRSASSYVMAPTRRTRGVAAPCRNLLDFAARPRIPSPSPSPPLRRRLAVLSAAKTERRLDMT